MTFTITDAPNSSTNALRRIRITPTPQSDMDIMKMEEESFMQNLSKK